MDAKLVVGEILDTGLKLSTEKDRIKNIFVKSGVKVTGDMKVEGVDGDAISVLKKLMDNFAMRHSQYSVAVSLNNIEVVAY